MKKTDVFKFDAVWWQKNKPNLMPPTKLGEAMRNYVLAKSTYEKTFEPKNYDKAMLALKEVDTKRLVAIGKCGVFDKDCKSVLEKGKALIDSERADLLDGFVKKHFPSIKALADDVVKVKANLQKVQANLDKVPGVRVGTSPTDPKQVAFEKVYNSLTDTYMAGVFMKMENILAVHDSQSQNLNILRKDPQCAPSIKLVVEGQKMAKDSRDLGEALNDWRLELLKVNPKAELKKSE